MPLLTENRQETSKLLEWTHTLGIALAIFLLVGESMQCPAQLSNSGLGPNFLVSGLALGPSVERSEERLVQAPKTSFHNNLGDTTWHAAQVHHCDLDAQPVRLPACATAFVPLLLLSLHGDTPDSKFGVASEQDH